MSKINWIADNSDYKSEDGKYIAIFQSSYRGLCSYKVYRSDLSPYERNNRNLLSIGGLPDREFWLQKGNDRLPSRNDNITKHGNAKDGCNICGSKINVIERILPGIGKMNACFSCIH